MDANDLHDLEVILGRGQARATTVERLQRCYGGRVGERQIRKGLEQLVMERDLPVVTLHPSGIFIAETPEELLLGIEDLTKHAMPVLKRISRLKRQHRRMTSQPLF